MIGQHADDGTTETINYFVLDHLGSVAAITDADGTNACALQYDPWGKRVGSYSCATTTRGFTDHEMIDEWDLVNMNARMYDPTVGRFHAPDPITATVYRPQSLNKYSYVSNNPLKFIDPTGLDLEEVVIVGDLNACARDAFCNNGDLSCIAGFSANLWYSDYDSLVKASASYLFLTDSGTSEFTEQGLGRCCHINRVTCF